MKISIHNKLFLLALLIITGNCILGYAVYKSNQKLLVSDYWRHHTQEVINQSGKIYPLANEIETGYRSFVITNDSTYLATLKNSEKLIFSNITQLRRLTRDNRVQLSRVDSLKQFLHQLTLFAANAVHIRNSNGLNAAVAYISGVQGKHYTSEVRRLVANLQHEEGSLLTQRTQTYNNDLTIYHRLSLAVFILMTVFTILLLIITGKYLFQNREKKQRAAELVTANKVLLFENEEKGKRATELDIANKELLYQNSEKEKRAGELVVANEELLFQNVEKENRAAELLIANAELLFQNAEKENRAAELVVANAELLFQNNEKEQRDIERAKMLADLVTRNNDLEQFAYIISHNLRAPIANIIGASNALTDTELSEEDKEILNNGINKSIIKLDGVVQDLNHILEIKAKGDEIKELVFFSELVDEVKVSIKTLIDKYDIEIVTDFAAVDELLTLKPFIYSVFYNLISNSVKYRRHDIPCLIKIKSRRMENNVKLLFTDNGMGIDLDKNAGHVFGLYRRFHTNVEGKGMGLYMVKTQVETLGGKIGIKSATNAGASFTIEFVV
ncbi:MAG: sensor histidine kinase [Mucilaginibacter sp.]